MGNEIINAVKINYPAGTTPWVILDKSAAEKRVIFQFKDSRENRLLNLEKIYANYLT